MSEGTADTTLSEDARTVKSIATMLGWMNVPPRHVLEADIRGLKHRAASVSAVPETPDNKAMDDLRRAVAETIGEDPETWPAHGNAALAIAAVVALRAVPETPTALTEDERERLARMMDNEVLLAETRGSGKDGWDDSDMLRRRARDYRAIAAALRESVVRPSPTSPEPPKASLPEPTRRRIADAIAYYDAAPLMRLCPGECADIDITVGDLQAVLSALSPSTTKDE